MALQTSGAISLNDIHIEAGGSSGTQASINDSDIRALIGKASGVQMSFSEWYGASAELYSGTVTTGTQTIQYVGNYYGYLSSASGEASTNVGSISPVDSTNFYSGADIVQCAELIATNNAKTVRIEVAGNQSNSGWTTLDIAGSTFTRSSATYQYFSSPNTTRWLWQNGTGTTSIFGTSGNTRAITIT